MNATALALALAAAACLAVASVLQHEAARQVAHDVGAMRLAWHLVRTPRWLLGRVIDTAALALQAFALAHGSLIAVQAAITTSVVMALGFEAVTGRRRVRRRELAGAAAVVGGVALLLAVGRPDDDGRHASRAVWVGAFVLAGALAVLAAHGARRTRRAADAASALAMATGVCFALDAASLKALGQGHGVWRVLAYGALFAAAALTGNLLVQRAFHLAPLNASLPVLTATTPVAGVLAGIVLFHEELQPGIGPRLVAVLAVGVLALGAAIAARARPHVAAPSSYCEP